MYNPLKIAPASNSAPNKGSTRVKRGPGDDTAQPPLTSGFGAVIEKERDLQAATEGSLGRVNGPRSHDIDRILRHHQSRLGANIALLEQRYESSPRSRHFVSWTKRSEATATVLAPEPCDEPQLLADLAARHAGLQTEVEVLIEGSPDGQRGELILKEVCRNHEEMAWMLTALLKEGATFADVMTQGAERAPDDV